MKIIYLADFSKENKLKREEAIVEAFEELGHTVKKFDESDFDVKALIEEANKSDLFFFNHGGVSTIDFLNFQLSIIRLETILKNIKCKKVFWFFERVIGMGDNLMNKIIPIVDYGFLNDETWIKRQRYSNIFPMHLAYGNGKPMLGSFVKELEKDIVFMGSHYETRTMFFSSMKEVFGDRFVMYNDKFGKDFYDVCESSKIIVSPKSPFDDFYWSDRIYKVLSAGGFLIHPRLEGIKTEFHKKECFETYNSWGEIEDKIKFWLRPENSKKRSDVAKTGRNYVFDRFSYVGRIRDILNIIK